MNVLIDYTVAFVLINVTLIEYDFGFVKQRIYKNFMRERINTNLSVSMLLITLIQIIPHSREYSNDHNSIAAGENCMTSGPDPEEGQRLIQ